LQSTYTLVPDGTSMMGFNNADNFSVSYVSATNDFELNGRIVPRGRPDREVLEPNGKWHRECQTGPVMSYLYGLRFFQLNETYRWHSASIIQEFDDTTGNLVSQNGYTGDYDVVTHNNMLGFQVGADLTFRECSWEWGMDIKAGPYVNFADAQSTIECDQSVGHYSNRISASKHSGSFIGELGIHASYKFRPTLVGRVSYDAMWVTGVAMAPEQIQINVLPANMINTNGTLFLQGVTIGLEFLR
jgi:hypothetical protein